MFFAKTSKTNYRIRWMTENGEIIHEENMNKNEVLNPNNFIETNFPYAISKSNYFGGDGGEFEFEFLGFRDIVDGTSPTTVKRNQTFVATFSPAIPVMVEMKILFKDNNNASKEGDLVVKKVKYIQIN